MESAGCNDRANHQERIARARGTDESRAYIGMEIDSPRPTSPQSRVRWGGSGKDRSMIRMLSKLLFGGRRMSSSPKDDPLWSTSSASTTDECVGPVDPLDPLKRDEHLPGADPIVPPVPPES